MGKTAHAEHIIKGFDFSVYFDKDGETAYRKQGGNVTETTYKFNGNKHCIFWKGRNRCANIIDNGDGTYTHVNPGGKHAVKWHRIVAGRDI